MRTTRGRFGNQAIPAGVAGAMNVKKGDAITLAKGAAVNVEDLPANLVEPAD
jgi:hypothetical protein